MLTKEELRELAKRTNPYDLSELREADRIINGEEEPSNPHEVSPYDLSRCQVTRPIPRWRIA